MRPTVDCWAKQTCSNSVQVRRHYTQLRKTCLAPKITAAGDPSEHVLLNGCGPSSPCAGKRAALASCSRITSRSPPAATPALSSTSPFVGDRLVVMCFEHSCAHDHCSTLAEPKWQGVTVCARVFQAMTVISRQQTRDFMGQARQETGAARRGADGMRVKLSGLRRYNAALHTEPSGPSRSSRASLAGPCSWRRKPG
jgi:hypothetical protein